MRDIADELDGIVNDLLGIVDALQLGGFIEVNEVFVEVQAGRGQQGAGIIVEVGGYALAFFFLQADRSVEQHFLLFLFQSLQLHLVLDHLPLVEDDENNKPNGQCEHPYRTEEEYQGNRTTGVIDLEEEHGLTGQVNEF